MVEFDLDITKHLVIRDAALPGLPAWEVKIKIAFRDLIRLGGFPFTAEMNPELFDEEGIRIG